MGCGATKPRAVVPEAWEKVLASKPGLADGDAGKPTSLETPGVSPGFFHDVIRYRRVSGVLIFWGDLVFQVLLAVCV